MRKMVFETRSELGAAAGQLAADALRSAIAENGEARLVVATGASQFETLASLIAEPNVDWSRVTGFHLDEYLGLSATHPASFRRYLRERFVEHVPLREFHYINGEATGSEAECARLGQLISARPIDVALIGVGENGHIAFNDPPADFETEAPYIVVELDEACRRQQLGEGWFATLDDVPQRAISMSVRQILKSKTIVCSVPDRRKAEAVKNAVEGPLTPEVPASILRQHPDLTLLLDEPSASLLTRAE